MNLKSVMVYGQKVPIKLKSRPLHPAFPDSVGIYCIETKSIIIDESLSSEHMMKTLFHEIGHALMDRLGFRQTSMPHDFHELIVEAYSNLMFEHFELKKKHKKSTNKPMFKSDK